MWRQREDAGDADGVSGWAYPCPRGRKMNAEQRFWSRVAAPNENGCRLWVGGQINSQGYGRLMVRRKMTFAHRFAYLLTNGPIPEGMVIMHKCDIRLCVEPSHLAAGTQKDNMMDASAKRRCGAQVHPETLERGENRYCARLTEEDVREIRKRFLEGAGVRQLAKAYGVNNGTISNITRRKRWKHVE